VTTAGGSVSLGWALAGGLGRGDRLDDATGLQPLLRLIIQIERSERYVLLSVGHL